MSAAIASRAVIRAIHDLHSRSGWAPSANEIADYLEADVDEVRPLLRELRRRRLFTERSRRHMKVWMPWGETTWP